MHGTDNKFEGNEGYEHVEEEVPISGITFYQQAEAGQDGNNRRDVRLVRSPLPEVVRPLEPPVTIFMCREGR